MVGFDGIDYSLYFHPSLTTVVQPVEEMGRKSIEVLFALLKDMENNQHIILETELQERESCKKIF